VIDGLVVVPDAQILYEPGTALHEFISRVALVVGSAAETETVVWPAGVAQDPKPTESDDGLAVAWSVTLPLYPLMLITEMVDGQQVYCCIVMELGLATTVKPWRLRSIHVPALACPERPKTVASYVPGGDEDDSVHVQESDEV